MSLAAPEVSSKRILTGDRPTGRLHLGHLVGSLHRAGKVGDVEVKKKLIVALRKLMGPIRERMHEYAAMTGFVDEIIWAGTRRMRTIAQETMKEVRKALGLDRTIRRVRRAAEKRAQSRSFSFGRGLGHQSDES
jgi:hypothetical protein